MKLFSKKSKTQYGAVQTAAGSGKAMHPFSAIDRYSPANSVQYELYTALKEAVPVIDAAIGKIVRLVGTFELETCDKRFEEPLRIFAAKVATNGSAAGLHSFVYSYLEQLITYGTAVGEMVPDKTLGSIQALYCPSLRDVSLKAGESPLDIVVCRKDVNNTPVENQNLVFATLLNPTPGTLQGTSIMKGLPFVSGILLKIFGSIGNNWERAGNIRYAVNYNPSDMTGVNARQRAKEIAREWSAAMRDDSRVCDFVSVGDVSVKVIGADNQVLDCDVPIKHLLEQIVSKLCIPPFLLGLSWSSTERMSSVQTDILTSELEYFRMLLTPVIEKICETQLRLMGSDSAVIVNWSNISLQDEVELAQARLNNAKAKQIEDALEVKV